MSLPIIILYVAVTNSRAKATVVTAHIFLFLSLCKVLLLGIIIVLIYCNVSVVTWCKWCKAVKTEKLNYGGQFTLSTQLIKPNYLVKLCNTVKKCLEFQLPLKINFVDFKAAFDSVHRESLWKILEAYGLPEKIVNIMKNTYDGSECCVKVDGETTE